MNKPKLLNSKIAAGLACLALLIFVSSASAQLTVTTSNQQGTVNTYPFTPTWTPAADSLILGLAPTIANGNFRFENTNRNVLNLTSGGSLTIDKVLGNADDSIGNYTTSTNYVTCGNGNRAGSLLVYTLPASAKGYNLTNITVYGGWADNGRDGQAFTVLYSTVANPNNFIYLTTVNYNPSVPGNTASANREVINDSSGGVIAANVYAVQFDFTCPGSENGTVGYGAITVEGTAAASVVSPVVSITTSNESGASPFTPTWTPETPDLIAGLSPSTMTGNFTQESSGGTPVLTDGLMGQSGTVSTFATCGASGGSTLIYTLTNVVNGSDVTNIIVYTGWGNGNRDGQYYNISYSTISAPLTYIPITTVYYNPQGVSGASANRVAISTSTGVPLASGVANLKFDFSIPPGASSFDNAYVGYSEIIVQGGDTAAPPPPPSPLLVQDTLPSYAETVVGDQVVFSATYSNFPPVNLQWQQVVSGPAATNNINAGIVNVTNNGVVTSTLTLNNVQLTNSGSYRLEALNATNGAAAPSYSTAAALVVGNVPAPVNNVILDYASQTGLGAISPVNASTNFYPTWIIDTNNDLILGAQIGSGATYSTPGAGNFGLGSTYGDPTILSDGSFGYLNWWPAVGGSPSLVSCGTGGAAPGLSMTYTLDTSSAPNGFDLTNITVYGGWGDGGRNEQKYQVLYSTVAAPTVFNSLGTFDYNPNDPNGTQSATRVRLLPAMGVLAGNVSAVEINWNLQGSAPKNGWEGYSEILIKGVASAPKPILTQSITPLTAEDVVGSSLTLTAGFSGATSYQWLKNGTNIDGATTTVLTLTNLQFSDTATNGGYSLVASNSSGATSTRACAVIVDPAPAAVNNVITAFAYQTSDQASFGPTWDTSALSSSLNWNAFPSGYDTVGDFSDPDGNPASHDRAGGLAILTDSSYGVFANDGSHPAFATCGPNAGQYVIYTMPDSGTYGDDITNIQIAGGWNDNGRDSQYYTVSYSTVANPTMFIPLAVVETNLSGYGAGDETTVRATMTPATGVLASNVYAIYVDFFVPVGVPNGYSGYSEISVFGSPSANPPPAGPVITTQHEEYSFDWTVETPNLIANQLPSSYGPGAFTDEGCNETNLTDGVIGFGYQYGASCGDDGTAVPWIIFSSTNGGGWDLTNIVVYTLWHDYGRDGQFYNVSYSTLSAPNTFLPLASVTYNPYVPEDGRASGNRVAIAPPTGQTMLASNVAAVKFDFTPQGIQDYGWSGYSEIVLQGSNLVPPTPPVVRTPVVLDGNLILTGTGGTPNTGYAILTTTNLLTPLVNWMVSTTGMTDGAGAFSNAIPINASQPASFFELRMP